MYEKAPLMEVLLVSLLNGLVYGMLLFMLASGLTLIFSMMGVLNFAHASMYMLGAYFAYSVSRVIGFWPALVIAPILCGVLGALIEMYALRRVHRNGHIAELLFTVGLAFIIEKGVQMAWGLLPVPYRVPPVLDRALFHIYGSNFHAYRGFMLLISVLMFVAIWLLLTRTRIGLVIQAALTHPEMVGALGHNVPRVFTIVFVVVVFGGLGSLTGCFVASLIMGLVQTYAVVLDVSFADLLARLGLHVTSATPLAEVLTMPLPRVGALLPYLMLILVLLLKPRGLMGTRDT